MPGDEVKVEEHKIEQANVKSRLDVPSYLKPQRASLPYRNL